MAMAVRKIFNFQFSISKQTLFVLLFIFLFLPSSSEGATLQKPPTNLGLVGYWSFNEGTTTVATDFSGNGKTGTLSGFSAPASATSGWSNGKLGNSLNFDGTDDKVAINQPIYPSNTNWTVSAWFKSSDNLGIIYGESQNGANNQKIQMTILTGKIRIGIQNSAGTVLAVNSTQSVNDGAWHHAVFSDSNGTATLYIDGVADASNFNYTRSGSFLQDASTIGCIQEVSCNDNFVGSIDEVRLYTRALTAAEAVKLYQSGLVKINSSQNNQVTNGLIGMWSFDGADVTNKVYDRSGQGNNGYFVNGATSTAKTIGKLGQALTFDGTDDYVDIGDQSIYDFGTSNFSVTGWVKTIATGEKAVIAKRTVCNEESFWNIRKTPGNQFSFEIDEDAGGTDHATATGGPTINDGVWHHFAGVREGVVAKIYVDGVFAASASSAGITNISNTASVSIGNGVCGALNAQIDDIRIYNRALTGSEVTQIYNMGGSKINTSQPAPAGTTLGSGLVGYWSFNGSDVTDKVYDRSGGGNHGYFLNGATSTAKTIGKMGQGLIFDGSDDVVDFGTFLPVSGATARTVSFWIKPTADVAGETVSWGTDPNRFNMRAGNPYVPRLSVGPANCDPEAQANDALVPGQWNHVVWAGQDNLNTYKLYREGVLIFSCATNSALNTSGAGLTINGDFLVTMDEVRIYNRELSAFEIKQLYLLGK